MSYVKQVREANPGMSQASAMKEASRMKKEQTGGGRAGGRAPMAAPSAFGLEQDTKTGVFDVSDVTYVPYEKGVKWMSYVKQVRNANPGMSQAVAMKEASRMKKEQIGGGCALYRDE